MGEFRNTLRFRFRVRIKVRVKVRRVTVYRAMSTNTCLSLDASFAPLLASVEEAEPMYSGAITLQTYKRAREGGGQILGWRECRLISTLILRYGNGIDLGCAHKEIGAERPDLIAAAPRPEVRPKDTHHLTTPHGWPLLLLTAILFVHCALPQPGQPARARVCVVVGNEDEG